MIDITDLVWLIPIGPLLASALIALGAHRSPRLSRGVALLGMGLSALLSQIVFWSRVRMPEAVGRRLLPWFTLGRDVINLGVYLDPTDAVMLVLVSSVCLLIFIYSIGDMRSASGVSRFFAYVSLLAGATLGAVVCDSLLTLFIFWEIMSLCSYLLSGLRGKRSAAVHASLTVFLFNKVGDVLLFLGLLLLAAHTDSLAYVDLFGGDTVYRLAVTPYLGTISVATVAVLLLFGGAIGRIIQLPLHLWLPDATERPTVTSALICAVTVVPSGAYLMIRAFPLLAASDAMPVLAAIGTLTAVFAAIVAVAQNDIRRVLAFAIVSQLGYIVAALGIGAYAAGLFHLVTQAFFSALLYMAAGSVIYGMGHGHRRTYGHAVPVDPSGEGFTPGDMWQMGGLAFRMPVTAISFLAGSLALSGFPLIASGFWSKAAILREAWASHPQVFWGLLSAAGLTAFYVARQAILVFLGKPRSRAAMYARESPLAVILPLAILAVLALVLGWIGIPRDFPVLGRWLPRPFDAFVSQSLPAGSAVESAVGQDAAISTAWFPLGLGVFVSLGGLCLGWLVYGSRPLSVASEQGDPLSKAMTRVRLGWLHRAIVNRFYLNEVAQRFVVVPTIWLAEFLGKIDQWGIDKLVDGVDVASHRIARSALLLDDGLLDGLVNFMTRLCRLLARLLRLLDEGGVDGLVRAITGAFGLLGRWARRIHNGQLADYLWNALMAILLLIAALVLLQYA